MVVRRARVMMHGVDASLLFVMFSTRVRSFLWHCMPATTGRSTMTTAAKELRCSFHAAVYLVALFLLTSCTLIHSLSVKNVVSPANSVIAPELSPQRIQQVSSLVAAAMGDEQALDKENRYASARNFSSHVEKSQSELVYGELSIPVLATLLEAVGVERGDSFLDIGSGDGALVLGASLLYSEYITKCRGLEIVPGLVARSKLHANQIQQHNVSFHLGDVHEADSDSQVASILQDTTLAVCFATTWSAGNIQATKPTSLQKRMLPKLSKALARHLPCKARIIMVDARLDCKDGFTWEGDLKIHCPDTAPFSIASLYQCTR